MAYSSSVKSVSCILAGNEANQLL